MEQMFPRLVQTGDAQYPDRILTQVPLAEEGRNEAWLRDFLLAHPAALPTADIDPAFANPVPICREMATRAGRIDALFANRDGALTIVECKLWRNPEARREVVAQILDYAKELAGWRYEDLQREVSRATGRPGENALFRAVAARHPEMAEARFVDAVTRNLATGRFLLVIVGDGIREGTESIARYVAEHTGLRFTLGLIEFAAFESPIGGLLVQPRVLARTVNIQRTVILVEGAAIVTTSETPEEEAAEFEPSARSSGRSFPEELKQADRKFWQGFRERLRLDDPTIAPPRTGYGRAYLDLGVEGARLTAYSARSTNEIGVFMRFRGDAGRNLYRALEPERATIDAEILAGLPDARCEWSQETEFSTINARRVHPGPWQPNLEDEKLAWVLQATNLLVNTFAPRLRALQPG